MSDKPTSKPTTKPASTEGQVNLGRESPTPSNSLKPKPSK